jgi:hypothetical protein
MAGSQTHRDDRQGQRSRDESRTSDDGAGAGKSARACSLPGKGDAAVPRRRATMPQLDPPSARAATSQADRQPIAVESTHRPGELEDYVQHIVDNAPPLTEAQRNRVATLLHSNTAGGQAQEKSRRRRRQFKLHQDPASAVQGARTEEQHQ